MTGTASLRANATTLLSATRMEALFKAALFQGWRHQGRTWPNPSVGAVLADARTGEIISSGVTGLGGRPHAEIQALTAAGTRAKGAVMFVTLEPCSHQGKTPPCADAIVEAGVSALVYGIGDPNPLVNGNGLLRLSRAGVDVIESPCRKAAERLHAGHLMRTRAGRPFVRLKLALDAEHRVPIGTGAPVWVTGEAARAAGHLLRARTDAILTGSGTLLADNPRLDCRLPGLSAASPVRVVMTKNAAALFGRGRAVGLSGFKAQPFWVIAPKGGTSGFDAEPVIEVEADPSGEPSPLAALRALAQNGITELLIEAGPTLANGFLQAGLVDEVILMHSSHRITSGAAMPAFGGAGIDFSTLYPHFSPQTTRRLGSDTIAVYQAGEKKAQEPCLQG